MASGGPGDYLDLGDLTGEGHVLGEDPCVAVERGKPLLYAGAAGLDEADHWHARVARVS
jgi:hypothetical protein